MMGRWLQRQFWKWAGSEAGTMFTGTTPVGCFTNHNIKDIKAILSWLKETPRPVECFDAFLYEYRSSGNLAEAQNFACREWNC